MSDSVPTIDIRPDHWAIVRDILAHHVPDREVWAFGSRATWTAKDYSDLDLVILGDQPLPPDIRAALGEDFAESDLPYKVDLVEWVGLGDGFKEIIRRDRVVVRAKPPAAVGEGGSPPIGAQGARAAVINGQATAEDDLRGTYGDGWLMEEWHYRTVEELAAPTKSALATGPFGSAIGSKTFRDIGVPVIRGGNLSAETGVRLIDDGLVFVDKDVADQFSRSVAKQGDLIFTCWGTTDQVGFIDNRSRYERYIVSNKQMKFTPDLTKIQPLFAYYFFCSPEGKSQMADKAIGSSVPGFNLTGLKSIIVPVPSLAIQQEIVSLLGSLDDKIELNRRMNETLEALARAIFKDWFVDFGPTRAKMEGRAPYLAPDIWSLFPDRLDDEGKPEGWKEEPLTHFFEIIGGGTPKTSEPAYWGGAIPWFSVVDTPAGSDTFVFNTEKYISDDGLKNSSARLLDLGDTIISARGTVGNLAMAGQPMAFNQSCYGLTRTNGYGQCFVFLAAKHMVSKLQSLAHGSVFSTITRQTFESILLPSPGSAIAEKFELASSALFDRIRGNVAESNSLAATRDFLLPKLMSGEVRIKDAEKLVGEAV